MNKSIFTVAGPIMIGPSSSHTAGAAKIGRVAKQIVKEDFDKVEFLLHGSFEKTGKGHGTDKALLAGVMGIFEDDDRIPKAFEIARERGIEFSFGSVQLENAHENSVRITFYKDGDVLGRIEGASIGGGEILITKIDGYGVKISGNLNTIFVRQEDKKGVIGHISSVLADGNINIATMNVSRSAKSEDAMCIIEVDDNISSEIADKLADFKVIKFVRVIDIG
ncbi:MAG: L-serine ammonia-lyase, iron-sulfur-dependent subunit beta [Anaerovoracaceae bacterium]